MQDQLSKCCNQKKSSINHAERFFISIKITIIKLQIKAEGVPHNDKNVKYQLIVKDYYLLVQHSSSSSITLQSLKPRVLKTIATQARPQSHVCSWLMCGT